MSWGGRLLRLVLPALVLVPAVGCSDPQVPTHQVERALFQHRVTAEGTLQAEKTTAVTVPPEVRRSVRLAWLAADGSRVEEGDVVARFDPTDMQQRLAEGESDLAIATFGVGRSQAESESTMRELHTDLQVAVLELGMARRFQKTDDSIYSRHDIIESEVDEELAGERKQHAIDSQSIQQRLARTHLELLEIKQRRARLKIDQAQGGLHALEAQAPHAGLLTLSRDWRGEPPEVGAEMWRGQEIAEIPDLSRMEAQVFVLEADAGGLEEGKPATVVVEAHPDTGYEATIKRIEAIAKPQVRGSPVQYFGVRLELAVTDPAIMKPGHRVRATLLLEDRQDALVVPRQAVFQEDGSYWVYVRKGRRFVPRTVAVAASSMGLVVIGNGLEEGDEIALQPPPDADRRPVEQQAVEASGGEDGRRGGVGTGRSLKATGERDGGG